MAWGTGPGYNSVRSFLCAAGCAAGCANVYGQQHQFGFCWQVLHCSDEVSSSSTLSRCSSITNELTFFVACIMHTCIYFLYRFHCVMDDT